MFCQQCGAEVKEGEKFCPKCGATVSENNLDETPKEAANTTSGNKLKKVLRQILIIFSGIIFALIIVSVFSVFSTDDDESNHNGGASHGSVSNKTEDILIYPGLSLADDPTWEVGTALIHIKGKVKAETWIGTSVGVHVTTYDKDGAILHTGEDFISDMQAGDIWRFEVKVLLDEDTSYFVIDSIYY